MCVKCIVISWISTVIYKEQKKKKRIEYKRNISAKNHDSPTIYEFLPKYNWSFVVNEI